MFKYPTFMRTAWIYEGSKVFQTCLQKSSAKTFDLKMTACILSFIIYSIVICLAISRLSEKHFLAPNHIKIGWGPAGVPLKQSVQRLICNHPTNHNRKVIPDTRKVVQYAGNDLGQVVMFWKFKKTGKDKLEDNEEEDKTAKDKLDDNEEEDT